MYTLNEFNKSIVSEKPTCFGLPTIFSDAMQCLQKVLNTTKYPERLV